MKKSDSSSFRGLPGLGSGPLESTGRDKSKGITLDVVACLYLSVGLKKIIAHQPEVRQGQEIAHLIQLDERISIE